MADYRIVLHTETLAEAQRYREAPAKGDATAGSYLQRQLGDTSPGNLSDDLFLEHLFATKQPMIFAESQVHGDGRDWNLTELAILGGLGVAVPVQVFDDGRHHDPGVYAVPWRAELLYIPGVLLRNDRGLVPADQDAVMRGGKLDAESYRALYERRLLPLFLYAQNRVAKAGRTALITVPGLGCGQFAGPYAGRMGEYLKSALIALLQRHHQRLPDIRAVYYDPYSECRNERHRFGDTSLLVRPLLQGNSTKPQLCPPARYAEAGDDFNDCQFFSIVAWDHVSWPGNDFYGGSRCTDDGVKAAATSSMQVITGVEGHYDPARYGYQPPARYRNWAAVVEKTGSRMSVAGHLTVLG